MVNWFTSVSKENKQKIFFRYYCCLPKYNIYEIEHKSRLKSAYSTHPNENGICTS